MRCVVRLIRSFFLCALLAPAPGAWSQTSPYFPDVGTAALHQRFLDLKSVAVVLSVSAEPGDEDFATLAELRMGSGARIVSVYLTNGGSTPSDVSGDLPSQVAATRKLEAARAVTLLGGASYFLNIPDLGVPASREGLLEVWKRDTVVQRLARAICQFRPDVVLLSHDARAREGDTLRFSLIRDLLPEAARLARNPHDRTGGNPPWSVARIFVEDSSPAATFAAEVESVHPYWRKSYVEIGAEAAGMYRSLRLSLPAWNSGRDRRYRLMEGSGPRPSGGIAADLPKIPRQLGSLAGAIRAVLSTERAGNRTTSLRTIVNASGEIDRLLDRHPLQLSHLEKRVVAAWRNGLEDLRCTLLNVHFVLGPSDSVLAPRQLFTLDFTSCTHDLSNGTTEILFPAAMDGRWYVNESTKSRFPFKIPSEFRVVTPEQIPFNVPASTHGLNRPEMSQAFPYIVIHHEKDPTGDFAYRGAVQFVAGPVRSAEILTPVVRARNGERLVFSLGNISRDPFRGDAWVGDSLVEESHLPVAMSRKDEVVSDTIALAWRKTLPEGDYVSPLHIGKTVVGEFLARSFHVSVDTSMTVGLLTGYPASPLADALRRLGVHCLLLGRASLDSASLARLGVILVERDATVLRQDLHGLPQRLRRWVAGGGRLIVFPQRASGTPWNAGEGIPEFIPALLPPEAAVVADSLPGSPNTIVPADWNGWVMTRARNAIVVQRGEAAVIVRAEGDGRVLLASVPTGKGSVIAVALDLASQLEVVHAGAFRILANLLSNGL